MLGSHLYLYLKHIQLSLETEKQCNSCRERTFFKTVPFPQCRSLRRWKDRLHHLSRCQVSASRCPCCPFVHKKDVPATALRGTYSAYPVTHLSLGDALGHCEESSRSSLNGQKCSFPRERRSLEEGGWGGRWETREGVGCCSSVLLSYSI